jgi:demethylmenaquinone methyltransferase / 2-methoxy-6-polyprenyl-1,4-benzoquinol methylase
MLPQAAHTPEAPSRSHVWQMFDRIAHRYDLLNRLLSFGTDVRWRKKMARHLPPGEELRVLDLATGTADVLLSLTRECPRVVSGVGVDMSLGMLLHGKEKLQAANLFGRFPLVRSDATCLGLAAGQFDAVTIAFGIRNVLSVDAALLELHRVLRSGGRALILEFSLPRNPLIRRGYLFYFRHILPRLGALISGDSYAYRYLNQSVETFPYGEDFCDLMRTAGFRDVQAHPLTFGIATLYVGARV